MCGRMDHLIGRQSFLRGAVQLLEWLYYYVHARAATAVYSNELRKTSHLSWDT